MSLKFDTPNPDVPLKTAGSKRPRVLACVLCQQRKVKCNHQSPCNQCIKSRVECIPTTLAPRRRKRRFTERDLLDRLRKYEELLRQNKIPFQALDKLSAGEEEATNADESDGGDDEPSPGVESPTKPHGVRNAWNSIDDGDDVSQVVRQTEINSAWDPFRANDNLLFGTSGVAVDVSDVHPMPVHILKLWQIYLENVNPLLKVTHTPSLQPRIIEAAGNFTEIDPALETLMFSIYCMAIQSLPEDECMAIFGSSRQHLLPRYQGGCQQALLNCGFLRRNDRDSLTALYLYLMSLMSSTVPQSLSSILGIAIRTAQRMGIHNESTLSRHSILEAELRRRLWWALVIFDTRVGEMAGFSTTTLGSHWTCKPPLNVSDSDLRTEMKKPPDAQMRFTEATFAVVRGEIADFVRHAAFHLEITNQVPKSPIQNVRHAAHESLSKLEEKIDAKYLHSCDLEDPLHFMTTWMKRAFLSRHHLMDLLSRYPTGQFGATDPERTTRLSYALEMLKCDTMIRNSSLTRGYRWLADQHFPFFAYIIIVQVLMRYPRMKEADDAWEIISDHFEARFTPDWEGHHSFFLLLSKIISRAWKARELAFKKTGDLSKVPRVVATIARKLGGIAEVTEESTTKQSNTLLGMSMEDLYMPIQIPAIMEDHNWMYATRGGAVDGSTGLDLCFGLPGQAMDVDSSSFDFGAMDWDALLGNSTTDSSGPTPPYYHDEASFRRR
ncbi:C6 transcription factor [Venturia nashicola]|nr:C6 transcription factor [Venturia nashicola]